MDGQWDAHGTKCATMSGVDAFEESGRKYLGRYMDDGI